LDPLLDRDPPAGRPTDVTRCHRPAPRPDELGFRGRAAL